MPDHTKYLNRVAISSLVNSITSALATVLLLPYIIKRIGIEAYGYWAILTIFIGIASALDFGIWKSLIFLIPRQEHTRHQLLSSAIVLCMIGWLVFTAILMTLLLAGVPIFGSLVSSHGNLRLWLAAAGSVVVFASLMTNIARGALEAAYRGHWVNIGWALLTLLLYSVATLIVHFTEDPRALIAGSVCVYVICMLAHLASLTAISSGLERPQRTAVAAILSYGGASFVADAPVIVLAPLLSYLLLLVATGSGDYGVFDISLRIATLAATTLALISAPFFTIVASAHSSGQSTVRKLIARRLRVTICLGVLGWSAFYAVGRPLLAHFFVERPAEIYRASVIIMLGAVAVAALEPVTRMLMGIGHLKKLLSVRIAMLGSALAFVVIASWLAPLDRFAISCAVGYGISATGLLILNMTERWGHADEKMADVSTRS